MGKIIRNGITYGGSSTIAGNVSYDNTTSSLTSVTVQNAITELKSLFDNSEHIRMEVVTELPPIVDAEDNVIYLIDEDASGIYEMYVVAEVSGVRQYLNIGETDEGTPHFVGTSVEWEALSAEEKAKYENGDIVFTDDNEGIGIIDDVITSSSPNPVSSRAIYAALSTITRPTPSASINAFYYGRTYYDGRQLVHYRRHFEIMTLSNTEATSINLGSPQGLSEIYDAVINSAFNDNNNIISMLVLKDSTSTQVCQINRLSKQGDDYIAWVSCVGDTPYSGDLIIDFVIDTF